MRRALAAFRSERYLRVNDGPPPALRDPVMGFYATRDGRWIQLHTNFPHHLAGMLKVLGCANDRAAVAEAIRGWDGAVLDQTLADAGLCAALIRSPREWAALEQARAIANLPLFEIMRIGDAPPEPRRARRRRPAAGRRAGARPVADHCGAGGGARARAAWRAGADDQWPASAEYRAARDRQRPRQALGDARSARRGGRASSCARWWATPMCSCRPTGRVRSPRAVSHPRRWRRCGLGSSTCRFLRMGTQGRGHSAVASTAWCSPRAALRGPRAARRTVTSRSICRVRRSITPPAISRRSARWSRWRAGPPRAVAGMCACRWRRRGAGCNRWGRSRTAGGAPEVTIRGSAGLHGNRRFAVRPDSRDLARGASDGDAGVLRPAARADRHRRGALGRVITARASAALRALANRSYAEPLRGGAIDCAGYLRNSATKS